MRKILCTLVLSLAGCMAFCQQDSLLKNFKYRIDHYRAISFGIGASGTYNKSEYQNQESKGSNFNSNVAGSYTNIRSTDKLQSTTFVALGAGLSRIRNESQQNIGKSKSYGTFPSLSLLNRYFYANNAFFELGVTAGGGLQDSKTKYSEPPLSYRKDALNLYDLYLQLGIGKGRLENITDMQNALWLNKVLQKAGRLTSPLSPTQLNNLGRSITKGNNTRVLDARRRTQFILATVDAFLQQEKLVSQTDIKYFNQLNDIVFFASNNTRFSGVEKFIRLTPSLSGSKSRSETSETMQRNKIYADQASAVLEIGFGKYRPKNLVQQDNYGASIKAAYASGNQSKRFYTNNNLVNEFLDTSEVKSTGVELFYEHGFYPNTRTNVTVSFQTNNGYQDSRTNNGFYSVSDLIASADYFISYNTRFNFNVGAHYQPTSYLPDNIYFVQSKSVQLFANAGLSINL